MITHCQLCRKPFMAKSLSRQCPPCEIEEQENYHTIYRFLLKKPGSNVDIIFEETGIAKDRILKLFREGKFSRIEDKKFHCSRCSKPLHTASGGVCPECSRHMQNQIKATLQSSAQKVATIHTSVNNDRKKIRKYGLGS